LSNSTLNVEQQTPAKPHRQLVIEPSKGWASIRFGELIEYRELLAFLAWRDISVRYKQTLLGVAWAVIQPFFTMVVFSIFLGGFAKIPSDGLPYPIFAFAALLPWQYFSTAMQNASQSLVGQQQLLSKVYFPRLIIPISAILPGLVDFVIAFVVLLGMMLYYGIAPTINIIWLPLFLLLSLTTSLGVGLWLGALNVRYRDVRYAVPFLIQFWMFASPVAYPTSIVSEQWRLIYNLNPMTGVIEGFRWALLGKGTAPDVWLLVSAFTSLVLLTSGAFYFRRMERTFADIV